MRFKFMNKKTITYKDLVKRWKKKGLSEDEINGKLEGEFEEIN